jgi:murein DD-endopeptidase MepM/ murein hydrolase activator NlpD
MEGIIGKYRLPFLTIPFLFAFWLVTLASRQYTGLDLSERGIYLYNQIFALGGHQGVDVYDSFSNTGLPQAWVVYFKSLSAIFFQYHLFAGLLIAFGLIYYSRIAFLLSLVGFFSAYYFYSFIGANFDELNYSYIGFNFILTAIAVGGFFIVSSKTSFLWVVLLTPVISVLIAGSGALLSQMQLSTLSLPFNVVVLLFLYSMNLREKITQNLEIVGFQEFSPERNLYTRVNTRKRYKSLAGPAVGLPFMGKWNVSQAHSGEFTHQNKWRHAWDFVIVGPDGKQFTGNGNKPSDYYCYDKPVIAPADGWIEEILDTVDDNKIGEVNLEMNWGNTLVIKHTDLLFTQVSHLKKGSIKVKKGAFVKRGEIIASCGNSGRSPMPHIHFQVQSTPYIGSATLDYPLNEYILHHKDEAILATSDRPAKDDLISNISPNKCLEKALNMVPGQQLSFTSTFDNGTVENVSWDVKTDIYNHTFLQCHTTGARAWFYNDGKQFSFTWFEGNKKSLLFSFYLGAYKLSTGYYKHLLIDDELPLNMANRSPVKIIQDFIAPFYIFMKFPFHSIYQNMNDELAESEITVKAQTEIKLFSRSVSQTEIVLFFDHNQLGKITTTRNGETVTSINTTANSL